MSSIGLRYLSESRSREAREMGLLAESLYEDKAAISPSSKPLKTVRESLSESYKVAVQRYKEESKRQQRNHGEQS